MKSNKLHLEPGSHSANLDTRRHDANRNTSQANAGDISLSSDADTIRLVALEYNEPLSIDEGPVVSNSVAAPFDPYNKANVKSLDNRPRRSLDDLRKLSAEITKAKQYKRQ
jgi:hypothetical protein